MDKVNQWLTLVANLGVIAGILFLAYEIQVNTNAVRSSTYAAYSQGLAAWTDFQADHAEDLAAIQEADWEELTAAQQKLWIAYASKTFTMMEEQYLHHRAGALDDDVFQAKMENSVRFILEDEALHNGWSIGGWGLTEEFKEYMDERIKAAQATASRIGLPLTLPPKMQRTVDEQDSWRRTPSTKSGEEGFGIEREEDR